ncbi:hypothetical protein JCM5353_007666 [Sporobolomyces roseus]
MSKGQSLPPELYGEVLKHDVLNEEDLANCCLAGRRLLPFARDRLYETISLPIYRAGELHAEDGEFKWMYNPSSDLFLYTVEESNILRHLVTKLEITVHQLLPMDDNSDDRLMHPESMLAQLLRSTPQVISLTLPEDWSECLELRQAVYQEGERWIELDVDGDLDMRELESWSNLPNLKKLKCDYLRSRNGFERVDIPSQLEILHVNSIRTESNPLPIPSLDAKLRVLRCFLSHDLLAFVVRSPTLEHLVLFDSLRPLQPPPDSSILSQFSKLPKLRSFSFTSRGSSPHFHPTLELLLAYLPSSVIRLDFPRHIPFDQLSTFFASPVSSSIRTLGLSRQEANSGASDKPLHMLQEVCETKGIKIEYVDEVEGVFHM